MNDDQTGRPLAKWARSRAKLFQIHHDLRAPSSVRAESGSAPSCSAAALYKPFAALRESNDLSRDSRTGQQVQEARQFRPSSRCGETFGSSFFAMKESGRAQNGGSAGRRSASAARADERVKCAKQRRRALVNFAEHKTGPNKTRIARLIARARAQSLPSQRRRRRRQ